LDVQRAGDLRRQSPRDAHRHRHPQNAAFWYSNFGYATRHVPVVDAEWANYASTRDCWADALRYRRSWANSRTTASGCTRESWSRSASLTDPTRIRPGWNCRDGLNQGAGHQIMLWFYRQNK
jgi:hypothetical protein